MSAVVCLWLKLVGQRRGDHTGSSSPAAFRHSGRTSSHRESTARAFIHSSPHHLGQEPTTKKLCLRKVWVESTGVCFQSLARRSRYSIRPLKFECDCFLTQNAFSGTGTARHLGPTPRGRLKFGRMLACRTRTARNRRVKDVRRSVAGPLSAASARYLPIGDSDFGARVEPRFLEMAT